MTDSNLQERSERAFKLALEQAVEREFEARLASGDTRLPWVDGKIDPDAPPEEIAELKQRVIRALCARKWFEDEAPKFCQPLPLCEEERGRLFNSSDRRFYVVAHYGLMLHGRGWDFEGAMPFFDFVQQSGCR